MKKCLCNLKTWISSQTATDKTLLAVSLFLWLGFLFVVFDSSVDAFEAYPLTKAIMLILAFLLGVISALTWLKPMIVTLLKSKKFRLVFAVINAVLLIVATAMSNFVVAFHTSLPPEDFPTTTKLFLIVGYLFWMSAALLVAIPLVLPLFPEKQDLDSHVAWIVKMQRLFLGAQGENQQPFFLILRWSSLFMIVVFLFSGSIRIINHGGPMVRIAAYYLDYQELPNYPDTPEGEMVKVHDNGIISVARPKGFLDVDIQIKKIAE